MLFKHLSGLRVYKVLTVTVALMRTVQYMSKYFLQCNVSSLAEWRQTLSCNRSWQSQATGWEERNLEHSVHCLQSVFTQENEPLAYCTSYKAEKMRLYSVWSWFKKWKLFFTLDFCLCALWIVCELKLTSLHIRLYKRSLWFHWSYVNGRIISG